MTPVYNLEKQEYRDRIVSKLKIVGSNKGLKGWNVLSLAGAHAFSNQHSIENQINGRTKTFIIPEIEKESFEKLKQELNPGYKEQYLKCFCGHRIHTVVTGYRKLSKVILIDCALIHALSLLDTLNIRIDVAILDSYSNWSVVKQDLNQLISLQLLNKGATLFVTHGSKRKGAVKNRSEAACQVRKFCNSNGYKIQFEDTVYQYRNDEGGKNNFATIMYVDTYKVA